MREERSRHLLGEGGIHRHRQLDKTGGEGRGRRRWNKKSLFGEKYGGKEKVGGVWAPQANCRDGKGKRRDLKADRERGGKLVLWEGDWRRKRPPFGETGPCSLFKVPSVLLP